MLTLSRTYAIMHSHQNIHRIQAMLTLSFANAVLAIIVLLACDRKAAPRKPTIVLGTSLKLARQATMAYGHSVAVCTSPSYYRVHTCKNALIVMDKKREAMRASWQDYKQLSASLA